MKWNEAWEKAKPMLDGVVRGRAPGSDPGVELAFLDWGGEGELVVMHHANGFCAATYAPIAVALRDRYRVIAFDARGHGDSTPVSATDSPDAFDWHKMAADYAAALDHVVRETRRERVKLAIGHSFGGILTLVAAAIRPGLIGEALLLDPVVLPPAAKRGAWADRGPDLATLTRRRRAVYSSREEAYDHFAGRGLFKAFRPEALALYVAEGMAEMPSGEIRLKCNPEAEASVFDNGRAMDVFELAAQIDTPVRFVHAARGNFSATLYADLASQMPEATVESVDADHLFAMEEPQLVVERVLD